jgi:hypothetical protein
MSVTCLCEFRSFFGADLSAKRKPVSGWHICFLDEPACSRSGESKTFALRPHGFLIHFTQTGQILIKFICSNKTGKDLPSNFVTIFIPRLKDSAYQSGNSFKQVVDEELFLWLYQLNKAHP